MFFSDGFWLVGVGHACGFCPATSFSLTGEDVSQWKFSQRFSRLLPSYLLLPSFGCSGDRAQFLLRRRL